MPEFSTVTVVLSHRMVEYIYNKIDVSHKNSFIQRVIIVAF